MIVILMDHGCCLQICHLSIKHNEYAWIEFLKWHGGIKINLPEEFRKYGVNKSWFEKLLKNIKVNVTNANGLNKIHVLVDITLEHNFRGWMYTI